MSCRFASLVLTLALSPLMGEVVVAQGIVLESAKRSTAYKPLEQQLVLGTASVRARAAIQLAALGADATPAVETLYESLHDLDAAVRLNSAHALGCILANPVSSVDRLIPVLSDPDEHVRYAAEWAIAKLAVQPIPKSAVPRMIDALRHSVATVVARDHHQGHRTVMELAIKELEQQLPQQADDEPELPSPSVVALPVEPPEKTELEKDKETLQALVAAFETGDLVAHLQMIDRLSAPVAPELAETARAVRTAILKQTMLQSESLSTRYASYRWKSAAQDSLSDIFESLPSQNLPSWSIFVLEEFSPRGASDFDKLSAIASARSNSAAIRSTAAAALPRSRTDASQYCGALLQIVRDSSEESFFRAQVIETLAAVAEGSVEAAALEAPLLEILQDPSESWMVVLNAAQALARINPQSSELAGKVVTALSMRQLEDYELPGVYEAVSAFESLSPNSLSLVARGIESEDELAKIAALRVVRRLGKATAPIISELLGMFRDENCAVALRREVVATLASLGPKYVAMLADELAKVSEQCQVNAFSALACLGDQAYPAFDSCLKILEQSSSPKVRTSAALAIGQMGHQAHAARDVLAHIVAQGEDVGLCASAMIALSKIGAWQTPPKPAEPQAAAVQAATAFADYQEQTDGALVRLVSQLGTATPTYAHKALIDVGQPAMKQLVDVAMDPLAPTDQRINALGVIDQLPEKSLTPFLNLIGDEALGDTCESCLMNFEETGDIAPMVAQVVSAIQTSSNSRGTRRLQNVLRRWATGSGSGPGDGSLSFGSSLGSLLIDEQQLASPQPPAAAFVQAPQATGMSDYYASAPLSELPSEAYAAPMDSGGSYETALDQIPLAKLTPSPPPADLRVSQDPRYQSKVTVYYGTNRASDKSTSSTWMSTSNDGYQRLLAAACACGIICIWIVGYLRQKILLYSLVAIAGLVLIANWFGYRNVRIAVPVESNTEIAQNYGGKLSDKLSLGRCEVTLPSNHERGELESPSLLRLEIKRDPAKHVYLQRTEEMPRDAFFSELRGSLDEKGSSLLVFIHGYNVSFEEAALRTAQLASDLEFEGAPVFFSWPSQDNWYQYQLDKKNIELSVGQIKRFLLSLAEESKADSIHLIAHSMGNVGLTQALAEMDSTAPKFNQVVLAAPDIDADIFKTRIAPRIVTKAERCTLYTSKTDFALVASRYFNAGKRVGETSPTADDYPGLDVIDASGADTSLIGHSYYGNVSLIRDLSELLRAQPLSERRYVKAAHAGEVSQWILDSRYSSGSASAAPTTYSPVMR